MTYSDLAGWLGAALTLLTFLRRSMLSLRLSAIASNLAFISYGALAGLVPVLTLHLMLMPCNLLRLFQLYRSRQAGPCPDGGPEIHLLRMAFDALPQAAAIFDPGGRTVRMSPAFRGLPGASAASEGTLDSILGDLARRDTPAPQDGVGTSGRAFGRGASWRVWLCVNGERCQCLGIPLPDGGTLVLVERSTPRPGTGAAKAVEGVLLLPACPVGRPCRSGAMPQDQPGSATLTPAAPVPPAGRRS